MKIHLMIICITFLFLKSSFTQSFVDINANIPGLINSQTLDWGDYDNDGDLDLIIAGQLDTSLVCVLRTYKNDNGIFNKVNFNVTPLYYSFIRWIDYDNDGDLDFLYTGQLNYGSEPKTFLYENLAGNFIEHDLNINKSGYIDCGDYDNDGDNDFILIGRYGQGPYTCVFRNDSSSFTQIASTLTPLNFATAAFGDYDNDGNLDLVISGQTSTMADYKLLVYRNDSNDIFTNINVNLENINGYVSWGDYDNDGDLDILISGVYNYNEPITKIYNNQGNNQFIDCGMTLPQISGKSLFFNYDNDNDLDILIAGNKGIYPNTTTVIRIFRNENFVSFSEIDPQIYNQYGDFAIGDYDSDGDIDFAISGPNQLNNGIYSSRIYSNTLTNSIKDLKYSENCSIYPNPTKSTVIIKVNEKSNYRTDVFIYNINAELIRSATYYNKIEIHENLRDYNNGIYFIRLVNNKNSYLFKIIKE
jgi:hypothetical protein